VLLYSEFAGCASSFKGATLVNPFDADGVAAAVAEALAMGPEERAARHLQLER
jgi:trehalose-6-phosphate synthase